MKLTAPLFKFKKMFIGNIIKFRGSALKGKHRFVPPATRGTRYGLWTDWRNEEEAIKYISTPYVTIDEELAYLEMIGEKHQDVDPLQTKKIVAPLKQHYAVELLYKFDNGRKHEQWD